MHSSCSFFGGKRNDTIRRNVRCAHRFDRTKFSSNRYTIHDRQAHFFAYLYLNVQRWDATRCDVMLRTRWWNSLTLFSACVCLCILYCIDVSRTPRESHETAKKKTNSKNYIVAIVVVFGLVFNGFLYHVVCILPNRNV